MNSNDVHESLIRWLRGLWDIPVIKSHQGAKRPSKDYGMVNFTNVKELTESPSKIKYTELSSKNSEGLNEIEATPVVELEWKFLIFVYGECGEDYMRKLMSAFHLTQMQEPLFPILVIHDIGAINLVPELIDEVWEPRAQINLTLRGTSDIGHIIETIEEYTPLDIEKIEPVIENA